MNKHSAAACRALKIDKFLRTGNLLVFAGKIVITGWSRVNWYWTDWTQPQHTCYSYTINMTESMFCSLIKQVVSLHLTSITTRIVLYWR